MSKVKLLLHVVSDLRTLADHVQAMAEVIEDKAHNERPKPEQPEPAKRPEEKQITLEEVRAVLAQKSHEGLTAGVRALLHTYGASKLSQVDPGKYAELFADAQRLRKD